MTSTAIVLAWNCKALLQSGSKERRQILRYGYGFNIRFTDNGGFDCALYFESAIDLMSFMDYKLNHEKKSLSRCVLISMGGLKPNIVRHSQTAFGGGLKTVLCVDNDKAGRAFRANIANEGIPYIDRPPDEKYKDWNEQLADLRRKNKIVLRHIEMLRL